MKTKVHRDELISEMHYLINKIDFFYLFYLLYVGSSKHVKN
jgi:hypothetical protein